MFTCSYPETCLSVSFASKSCHSSDITILMVKLPEILTAFFLRFRGQIAFAWVFAGRIPNSSSLSATSQFLRISLGSCLCVISSFLKCAGPCYHLMLSVRSCVSSPVTTHTSWGKFGHRLLRYTGPLGWTWWNLCCHSPVYSARINLFLSQ